MNSYAIAKTVAKLWIIFAVVVCVGVTANMLASDTVASETPAPTPRGVAAIGIGMLGTIASHLFLSMASEAERWTREQNAKAAWRGRRHGQSR